MCITITTKFGEPTVSVVLVNYALEESLENRLFLFVQSLEVRSYGGLLSADWR